MNVLIIGSGGREHTLAWKIHQSPKCEQLFIAPGNGGTRNLGTNLPISVNDFEAIKNAVLEHNIKLVVVGPEEPLVRGIVDFLKGQPECKELLVIGPDSKGAQLEGSKDFAKQFMEKYGVPTAKAAVFEKESLAEGLAFLESAKPPYVLKADGLAAGKGVIITENLTEAKESLKNLLGGMFGEASQTVLIEEFLQGIELSVFVLTDGKSYRILPEAKDYKRIRENDEGPNTGGMGAVSPVIFADPAFMKKVEDKVVVPTVKGIEDAGYDYKGFIFIGLMNVNNEPYVIEYNIRMGDPETQVVLPRIKSDLLETLVRTANGNIGQTDLELEEHTATTVVMVSEGYPEKYAKGREISIGNISDVIPFHAGTIFEDALKTNGGRVMAVTGLGETLDEALEKSYSGVKKIHWEGVDFRTDIGRDLKKLGQ